MHGHRPGGDEASLAPNPAWSRALLLAAALTLVLGTLGEYEHQDEGQKHVGHALYHTLQLFLLHAPHFQGHIPWTLEVARWLAPVTGVGGVAAVVLFLRAEVRRRRLRRLAGHVVVCGLGRKGIELVRHLRGGAPDERRPVVVLERDPAPALVAECAGLGVQVLAADATRPDALGSAGVPRAASVFALCPDDATNCEIAAQVVQARGAAGGPALDCFVHLDAAELGQTLQQVLPPALGAGQVHLHAVDAFDPEAIDLLVNGLPLDHEGLAPGDPCGVRLVILGFGRMGRALAVRAAQLGQFANGRSVRIEVIDRHALRNRDALLFHHPHIGQAAELVFHQHEAASPAVRNLVEGFCRDAGWRTSVVIAFDNEPLALDVCLRLAPAFDSDSVRVALRLEHDGGIAHLLERLRAEGQVSAPGLARLTVFGTSRRFERLADPGRWPLEQFARRFHEAYLKLRRDGAAGDARKLQELAEDPAAKAWPALAFDLRDSNRQAAAHIHVKLRALGLEAVEREDPRPAVGRLDDDVVLKLARLEHRRWIAERRVAGWEPGEVKDVVRRRSPWLVEWERLPASVQAYDIDAVARIPAILELAGMKAVRRDRPRPGAGGVPA